MTRDISDADEKTEFLKRSETQLEKLEQLIASLMNISRLETAMISLTKESILLSDLLVDAVNGVYEKARRKSIEISVQETENITLHLDKRPIFRLFLLESYNPSLYLLQSILLYFYCSKKTSL